jgi:tetratricopeptide (TPR) repeat protein
VAVEYQKTAQFDLRAGIAGQEASGAPAPPESPAPQEFPLAPAEAPVPESQAEEAPAFDLSEDLAAFSTPAEGVAVEPKLLPFNYDEARVEIDFYLEQGFAEEAQKAVEGYEQKYPENPEVAALRRQLEERLKAAPPPPAEAPAIPPPEPAAGRVEAEATVTAPDAGAGVLDSLAGELASSLQGIEAAAPPPVRTQPPAGRSAGASGKPAGPLSGLLEELGEPADAQAAQDDPETHYSLGVAFREMGLLDEAIGEFQKVVKGTQKAKFPPHFLQACTLLAASFMDKKMPAIAVKWYLRALEMPDLDEEATLALLYDLGVAYEQSGESRTALEKFTEVYTQNIDYRDVAEKIRQLQQKVS